ncbi:energy transducer TonB [Xenorhabdus nematophila]|uniref:energy transducer TonB n=1 Tax=Xenorhabdus nematophila TaxID=628 RepID=UPI0032B80D7B
MTHTAIFDNPTLISQKGLLISILIAILLHINLIWLFNRHTSYPDDAAHHINNNASAMTLSITMVAASSWNHEPEPVSPPPPLLTAPESPTKPEIALDKAVHPENRVEKPQGSHKPKKRQKPQKEKPQEIAAKKPIQSTPVQKEINAETHGSDQVNSQSSMSRASTSQPLVGQGKGEWDNYHARLRQEIEHHKEYPRKAKRMKQQGIVIINFTLLKDGTLTAAKVVNSSGNSTLDNAALNAIHRARSVGVKPADIPSDVTLRLDFKLD